MNLEEIRSWMYCRRTDGGIIHPNFITGVDEFIKFCKSRPEFMQGECIRCACSNCKNNHLIMPDEVRLHLLQKGFVSNYYCWKYQGEELNMVNTMFETRGQSRQTEVAEQVNPDVRMVVDVGGSGLDQDYVNKEPNDIDKKFFEMLNVANHDVSSGSTKISQLEAIVRIMNLNSEGNLSEKTFDGFCDLIQDLLPKDNVMVKSFYETKKLIAGLGLTMERIDCCEKNCMLYWHADANLENCKFCGTSRYSVKKKCRVSKKYMFHFPLKDRLKRLYLSRATASAMRWHSNHTHDVESEMCHPCDSEAWRHFNQIHTDFAIETRNLRLGLSIGGFPSFGSSSAKYSTLPVIVIPYNLPPDMCMTEETMFLTAIIPSGGNPKHRIDVFLQPVIEELLQLWTEGVETYDVSMKDNFNLKAALLWTISDFPTYEVLSGWGIVGTTACPICMEETVSFTLPNEGKQSLFDCHRRFLPGNHPFRADTNNFLKGREEHRPPPYFRTSEEVLQDLDKYGLLKVTDEGLNGKNNLVCLSCGWRKRSIFWDLPYWKTNLLRHNLDVMQIEKHMFDNIFNTMMDVPGKTKDNVESREDMQLFCNRRELERNGRTGRYPKACYTLSKLQKRELLDWLSYIKFPDKYMSYMARYIDKKKFRMSSLKSHDCHVFIQRLLPIAFCELLPKRVWEPLTELSNFFRCLTQRVIVVDDITKLELDIPLIICKLETIFPPSFFEVMEHLSIHLAREVRLGGPVQFRWMHPLERYLGLLKKIVKNKRRVDESICHAYLSREASMLYSYYFKDRVKTRQTVITQNDDGGPSNNDSQVPEIFRYLGRVEGNASSRRLSEEEWKAAHTYVLLNTPEMTTYITLYERMIRDLHPRWSDDQVAENTNIHFANWFKTYVQHHTHEVENEIIQYMSHGPLHVVAQYSTFFINGYRFQIENQSTQKSTYNNGVCISAENGDYFGRIHEILELEYPANPIKKCVVFKCDWYDPTENIGTRVCKNYNLLEVHRDRRLPAFEPFILAAQAGQVYYLTYPGAHGSKADWLAVCKVCPREWMELAKDKKDYNAYQYEGDEQFVVSPSISTRIQLTGDMEQLDDIEIDENDNELRIQTSSDEYDTSDTG